MNAEVHCMQGDSVGPPPAPITPTPLYPEIDGPPLRVALVVPPVAPAWVATLATMAREERWLSGVVVQVDALTIERASLPADLAAFLGYERRRRTGAAGPFGSAPWDQTSAGTECVRVQNVAGAQLAMAGVRPDLILVCGSANWSEALAPFAVRGCWSLDANLLDPDAAACALMPPLLRGEPVTWTSLELVGPPSATACLQRSSGATQRASASRQRDQVFLKMPALLLRALRMLHRSPAQWPASPAGVLRLGSSGLPGAAGARLFLQTLGERIRWKWQQARQPHADPWFVVSRRDDAQLDPERPAIRQFAPLVPHSGLGQQIWADPCIVEHGTRRLLFVEECTPEQQRAHIACIELPENGGARRLGTVLECPWHLSFPQVFAHDNEWFMTVESGQALCTVLYQAEAFPLGWRPVAELISGRRAVDPVLYRHEGRWYLFVNIAESGGNTSDELFLFVADAIEGPFQPHPANPIVVDVQRARSAGPLFIRGGRLFRPAQDCGPSYGAATVFNEVVTLTPTEYEEVPRGRIGPEWQPELDGCHTYSASANVEVLDARGRLPRGVAPIWVG